MCVSCGSAKSHVDGVSSDSETWIYLTSASYYTLVAEYSPSNAHGAH